MEFFNLRTWNWNSLKTAAKNGLYDNPEEFILPNGVGLDLGTRRVNTIKSLQRKLARKERVPEQIAVQNHLIMPDTNRIVVATAKNRKVYKKKQAIAEYLAEQEWTPPRPIYDYTTKTTSNCKGFNDVSFELGEASVDDTIAVLEIEGREVVGDIIADHKRLQLRTGFWCHFHKTLPDGTIEMKDMWIPIPKNMMIQLLSIKDYDAHITTLRTKLLEEIEYIEMIGSLWKFDFVKEIILQVDKLKHNRGGTFVQLPTWIKEKQACINVDNSKRLTNECFLLSVLASKYPNQSHPCRATSYEPYLSELNVKGLTFPLDVGDIAKFEKLNPNISIRLFGVEDDLIVPMRSNPDVNAINLLFYENHYCWIKNFNKLLNSRESGTRHNCHRCLWGFSNPELLAEHLKRPCGDQAVTLPKVGSVCEFTKVQAMSDVPAVFYLDLESLLVPQTLKNKNRSETASYTDKLNKHEAVSICIKLVAPKMSDLEETFVAYGLDSVLKAFAWLKDKAEQVARRMRTILPMTEVDWEVHHKSPCCHICHEPFKHKDQRVRDHDHLTGEYRGPAHNPCNLGYRMPRHIPVISHNMKGYDSHFLIKKLAQYMTPDQSLCPIADSQEKYRAFTWRWKAPKVEDVEGCGKRSGAECDSFELRFIDSLGFNPFSLSKLVSTLTSESLVHTRREFGDKAGLMSQKGIFPYEYCTSLERLEETSLPSKEGFYSVLTGEGVSEEEYEHAQQVWKEMGCQTLKDYMLVYLRSDVALLADMFEEFRKTTKTNYELDPCHFYSGPASAWNAALKMTKVKLDLISDMDMYVFVESAKRGGVSVITHRHAEAKEGESNIVYLDANNLYGWAMTQKLPVGAYHWRTMTLDKILKTDWDGELGAFVEFDAEVPEELHDLMNDYPLLPESKTIDKSMLSPYASDLMEELKMKVGTTSKLVPNLLPKKNYIAHAKNLVYAIQQGIKVTRIGRVLGFKQSEWLSPYINFNTRKRQEAKSDFEKDYFKLMSNSVFGKTMEDVRGHMNVNMYTDEKKALRMSCRPTYVHRVLLHDDGDEHPLIALHMKKPRVELNKPIAVGVAILDLSKLLMQQFHYQQMMKMYTPQTCKLLMTDTDSLVYHIKTDNINRDMLTIQDQLDCSNLEGSPLFCKINNKVVGKMKFEFPPEQIREFVGLRSKLYCLGLEDGQSKAKAKGTQRRVAKSFTLDMYRDTLMNPTKTTYSVQTAIRSKTHEVYTIQYQKSSLCAFDDKRYLLADGVTSLVYGHRVLGQTL